MAQPAGEGEEPTGLYTTSDATALLGVTPMTLSKWADDGLIRVYRRITQKKHRLFYKQDVDAVAEDNRRIQALLAKPREGNQPDTKKKIA